MWLLTHNASDKIFYIKTSKTTLGRLGTDILLQGDESISRVHSNFVLKDNDQLFLEDLKSKYGTFLVSAGVETKVKEAIELNDGNVIRFGTYKNDWIVHRLDHKSAISMVEKKDKLVEILNQIKVKVTDQVDETCTHLTMPPLTPVSEKLLTALSYCVPVVTPKYWLAFKDSIESNTVLPKSIDFLPKIKEDLFITPGTISLAINRERQKVFAGKKFFFVSKKQMEEHQTIVKNAGGEVYCLSQTKMTDKQCCAKSVVFIQPKATASQSCNDAAVMKIKAALDSKKRRMIAESEIGLAIIQCSKEHWCNPESTVNRLIRPGEEALLKLTKSAVTVANTESSGLNTQMEPPKKVPRKRSHAGNIIETIDLITDDDLGNKENIAKKVMLHQNNESLSLMETEAESPFGTPIEQVTQISLPDNQTLNQSIPETQESSSSALETNQSNQQSLTSQDTQLSKISTRSRNNSNSSGLFNFSINNEKIEVKKNQRKRQISEEPDIPGPSKKSKHQVVPQVQEPKKRATRKKKILSDSSEEESTPKPEQTKTRKRTAAAALSDGLFNFNTNFSKKSRQLEMTQDPVPEISGIIPISQNNKKLSPVTKFDLPKYDDSNDAGIWLSKKMTSIKLSSSPELKSEPVEMSEDILDNPPNDSQDIKPSLLKNLFNVEENSFFSPSSSSIVSKRKSFVKKQNYKSQTCIVTMKTVNVAKTREDLLNEFTV